MLPDRSPRGAEILRLRGSCWVLWVKLPARGLHLAAPVRFTSGQGSSEGRCGCTRRIKGPFQLPGSEMGKKALAWGTRGSPCCSLPLRRRAKAVLSPCISPFIP